MNPFQSTSTREGALQAKPLLIYSSSPSRIFHNSVDHSYAVSVQHNPKFIALRERNYWQMLTVRQELSIDCRAKQRLSCRTLSSTRHNILSIFSFLGYAQTWFGIHCYRDFVSIQLLLTICAQRTIKRIHQMIHLSEYINSMISRQV